LRRECLNKTSHGIGRLLVHSYSMLQFVAGDKRLRKKGDRQN